MLICKLINFMSLHSMDETNSRAAGGLARAESLTTEQRKEIAVKAGKARWAAVKKAQTLPAVLYKGVDLNLAGISIPCAVVTADDGSEPMRVLTEHGITTALLGSRSGASKRIKKKSEEEGIPLPLFVAPGQLSAFIDDDMRNGPLRVIEYMDGGRLVRGYDAQALPTICEIWLKAREAGALQAQQLDKAQKAELLTRALAHVGIVALIDEATGYQKHRASDALAKILEQFIAKELQPYVKTFPTDFYEHLFRLRGLPFPPEKPQLRPQYFGILTNDIVYERLAPGLLEEMKRQAAKDEKKAHLHRRLTQEVGHPKLKDHLTSVVTVMKLSDTYPEFINKMNRVHPRFGQTYSLGLEDQDR